MPSPVSIIHIGLPLDHPSIPASEFEKLTKRLDALRDSMRAAGYNYEIVHYSPEGGLEGFRRHLQTQPCDGVLIGGGVVGNPELIGFMEQIVNTVRELGPDAKIMFFDHAVGARGIIERWFGPATNPAAGPSSDGHEEPSAVS